MNEWWIVYVRWQHPRSDQEQERMIQVWANDGELAKRIVQREWFSGDREERLRHLFAMRLDGTKSTFGAPLPGED